MALRVEKGCLAARPGTHELYLGISLVAHVVLNNSSQSMGAGFEGHLTGVSQKVGGWIVLADDMLAVELRPDGPEIDARCVVVDLDFDA